MKKSQDSIGADKLKGVLITRTAIKVLVPEDIVEKVIMFQFKDAKEAMLEHEQLEVSGFGKFMTSIKKINRRIEKAERALANVIAKRDGPNPERRKEAYDKMIELTRNKIAYLKTKVGGYGNKNKS